MLDLKALLTKILQMFSISKTQTFNACGKYWTFNKLGNVVWLDAPRDSSGVSAGYNTIGTLPSDMCPRDTQRIDIGNGYNINGFLEIGTNGVVRFYSAVAASGARNCAFSTSYITNGGGLNPITWLRTKLDTIFTPILNGGGVGYDRFKGVVKQNIRVTKQFGREKDIHQIQCGIQHLSRNYVNRYNTNGVHTHFDISRFIKSSRVALLSLASNWEHSDVRRITFDFKRNNLVTFNNVRRDLCSHKLVGLISQRGCLAC